MRARALRAPVFLGLLTCQTGRCAPLTFSSLSFFLECLRTSGMRWRRLSTLTPEKWPLRPTASGTCSRWPHLLSPQLRPEGLLTPSNGCNCILTVIDRTSRGMVALLLANTAETDVGIIFRVDLQVWSASFHHIRQWITFTSNI
jgi:hypothetical protein